MKNTRIKIKYVSLAVAISLSITACASRPDTSNIEAVTEYNQINDPMEPTNRAIFTFNNALDNMILEPIARGYHNITPAPFRKGVDNFLKNLSAPIILTNDLLQGEFKRSGTTFSRFLINTTIGVLGIFDPASDLDLPYHHEDFGQTLAVWGVGEGPYVMLPIFGPSNPRDITGKVVDTLLDPISYVIANNDDGGWEYAGPSRAVLGAINAREKMLGTLDELEKSSVDYYAAIRTLYRQSRDNEIKNGLSTAISNDMNDFDFYDESLDFDFPENENTKTEE